MNSSTLTPDILRNFVNPVFVETGTYKGDGIACALEVGFGQIYSIELDEGLVKRAQTKYVFTNRNIEVIKGDSGKILWRVIEKIFQPITFWLDSHKQLPNQPEATSILDELDQIKRHPLCHKHILLIDDMRFFRGDLKWHISLEQLIQKVRQVKGNVDISYIDSRVCEKDIMVVK